MGVGVGEWLWGCAVWWCKVVGAWRCRGVVVRWCAHTYTVNPDTSSGLVTA